MIKWYQKWLFSQNKDSGKSRWWLLFAFGLLLIIFWIASAAPCIAIFTGNLSALGKIASSGGIYELIIYSHWILQEPLATYYICAVVLCIPVAMVGYLMILIGINFANRRMFIPPALGHPVGYWVSR